MTAITQFLAPAQAAAAGATLVYKGQLVDANGAAVGSASVTALTLSIVDLLTGAIVNGVSAVDILNTGRGTLDTGGNLTITLSPSDTQLLRGDKGEARALVIDATYNGGTLRHEVDFTLVAMAGP